MAKHYKKKKLNKKKVLFAVILFAVIVLLSVLLINKIRINETIKKTEPMEDKEISYSNEKAENNIEETNSNLELANVTKPEQNVQSNVVQEIKSNTFNNIIPTESTEIATNTNGLPVLMYHFFYDETKTTKKDRNWITTKEFDAQMKYLSENNFYFPTWEEVENFIDGKTSLPSKSVVITADDGDPSFFELAIPILEKYNVKATSFVITSWYAAYCDKYQSKDINYQSHSDNMHMGGKNGKGIMLSLSESKILADVKKSSELLHGATIFCYPLGDYNDLDKKVLKEAGYKLAFTNKGGRVKKGSDKYALPRVRIQKGMSMSAFKGAVN